MSREATFVGARRVIRAGTPARVSNLSFPAILDLPAQRPNSSTTHIGAGNVTGSTTRVDESPVPAVDPAIIEEARAEATAQGYADGLAAGRADAVASVRTDAAALLARLDDAVSSLESRQQVSFDELTENVAQFAMATIETLLGRELALAEDPTRDAIARALRIAPDRVDATVIVHPDDLELLGPVDDLAATRQIELVADASIDRGGCIVRAADCEVDAQLSGALQRLRSVLGLDERNAS